MAYTTTVVEKDGEEYTICALFDERARKVEGAWTGFILHKGEYVVSLGKFDNVQQVWYSGNKHLDVYGIADVHSESLQPTDGPLALLEESEPERSTVCGQ